MHCTVTRQQVQRDGYLEEFARIWSENPHVQQLWFSLYTPQIGEVSPEILLAGRPRTRRRRADVDAEPVPEDPDAGRAAEEVRAAAEEP